MKKARALFFCLFLIVGVFLAQLPFVTPTFAETQEETTIISAIEKVSPSFITIEIEKTQPKPTNVSVGPFSLTFNFLQTPLFHFVQTPKTPQDSNQPYNIGSGFIVSSQGLILTNRHVVSDIDATYRVTTTDGKKYTVTKIYRDPRYEVAILKVMADNLPSAKLGNSDDVKVGQMAIAMGTVFGELNHTVTVGIISGMGRNITAEDPKDGKVDRLDNMIQTDAALNFGNSGGPLFNSSGEIIGVNTVSTVDGDNIGFSIPINLVKSILQTQQDVLLR